MEKTSTVAEQIFGNNKPPVHEVLKADFAELVQMVDRAEGQIKAAPTKIKDDTDFAATGDLIIRARKLTKMIEEKRKGETDPLYAAQKSIKAWFDLLATRVDKAIIVHNKAADDFARAKAAAQRRKAEDDARKLREKEAEERRKAKEAEGAKAARSEGRADQFAAQAEAAEVKQDMSPADAVRTKTANGGVATAATTWDYAIENYSNVDLNALRPFFNRDHVETAIRSMVRVQKGNTELAGVRVFQSVKAAFR